MGSGGTLGIFWRESQQDFLDWVWSVRIQVRVSTTPRAWDSRWIVLPSPHVGRWSHFPTARWGCKWHSVMLTLPRFAALEVKGDSSYKRDPWSNKNPGEEAKTPRFFGHSCWKKGIASNWGKKFISPRRGALVPDCPICSSRTCKLEPYFLGVWNINKAISKVLFLRLS